nr:MAG TPA: DNA polymerase III, delta subunit [Bacteriophage sp.]
MIRIHMIAKCNYDKEYVVEKILHSENMFPCLLIGEYVPIFKSKYKGTIERVYTLQEVRDLIQREEIVRNKDRMIVLDGIGYLSETGQNSLLKFIEESVSKIVLLSYTDRLSSIILSRVKFVYKSWKKVKTVDFGSIRNSLQGLEDVKNKENCKKSDVIQYYVDTCPSLYVLDKQFGDTREYTKERLIKIMTKKA